MVAFSRKTAHLSQNFALIHVELSIIFFCFDYETLVSRCAGVTPGRTHTQKTDDRSIRGLIRDVALLLAPCFREQIVGNNAHRPTEVVHNPVSLRRNVREEWELCPEKEHEIGEKTGPLERQGIEGGGNGRVLPIQRTEVMREAGDADAIEPGIELSKDTGHNWRQADATRFILETQISECRLKGA